MNTQLAFVGTRINMAPQAHRRWLVALIYLVLTVLIVAWAWFSRFAASLAGSGCLIAAIALYLLILHLTGPPSEATDERQKLRWDQARARAYPWLGYVLMLALFTWQLHISLHAAINPVLHGILQQLPYAILMAAGVLYLSLPQAILLWSEPDMDNDAPLA